MLHIHRASGSFLPNFEPERIEAVGQGRGIKCGVGIGGRRGGRKRMHGQGMAQVVIERGPYHLLRAREAQRELALGRVGENADCKRDLGLFVVRGLAAETPNEALGNRAVEDDRAKPAAVSEYPSRVNVALVVESQFGTGAGARTGHHLLLPDPTSAVKLQQKGLVGA